MRKFFYAFGLASALMFAVAEQAAAPNFAGTWVLEKSKSQGLTSSHRSFERTTWKITQTDKEISIDQTYAGFNDAGLPPARPGRGGAGKPIGPRIYNLDGSETIADAGRTKYVRKAILSSDGKTLELVEKTISQGTDGEVTSTSTDKLSLSEDGKVMTVIRHTEGSLQPKESTLVFNK